MATILDVAKLARVSKTTVSRYLNKQDAGHMSESTKERIREAIAELNYNPSSIARSLKKKRTDVIGFIVHDMTNPFFLQMLQGVEKELKNSNYHVLLCSSDLQVEKEVECLQMLEQKQIDGILLVGMNMPISHIKKLKIKAPIVLLERDVPNRDFDVVKINNKAGTYAAVEHLIQRGHTRIAHIKGAHLSVPAKERWEIFRQCMEDHGLEVYPQYVVQGDYKLESGYEAMATLMYLNPRPTAVFCANDNMAMGALRYLQEQGIRVPEEVALVGYDDIPMAEMVTPALTTVHQPVMELARTAAQLLLTRIQEGRQEGKTVAQEIIMDSELVVRKST